MSTTSLKAFIPGMASVLGTTEAALYERQRALVRAGLLEADAGRGPGAGVRANGRSITTLLISVLAAEGLSHAAERTSIISRLAPQDDGWRSHLSSFGYELKEYLLDKSRNKMVDEISVSRTNDYASITRSGQIRLYGTGEKSISRLQVRATIDGNIFRSIAELFCFNNNKINDDFSDGSEP